MIQICTNLLFVPKFFYASRVFICLIALLFFSFSTAQNTKLLDSIANSIHDLEFDKNFDSHNHNYINLLIKAAEEHKASKHDSLFFYAKKALQLSKEAGYVPGEINSLLLQGYYYAYNGNVDETSKNQQKAYDLAIKSNDKALELKAVYEIGTEYKNRSEFGKALQFLYKAIDLATNRNDLFYLSLSKGHIAHMFRMHGDYQQSLEIYKEILVIDAKFGDDFRSNISKANLSIVYSKLGQTKKALEYIDAAQKFAKKINHKRFLAYTNGVKGKVYEEGGSPKLALELYEISKNSLNEIDDKRNLAGFLIGMASAHFQLDNYEQAKGLALESLTLAKPLNLSKILEENYQLLYEIHKAQNNAEKAIEYHVAFKKIADSISRQINIYGLEALKAKMKFEEERKSDKMIADLNISKQKMYSYIGVASALILGFIIYLLLSRSKERQKLLFELEQSNQTKDKLFSIIGHDLRTPIMSLQQLLDLWRDKDIDDLKLIEYVPTLSRLVEPLSLMLNSLLTWSSAEITGIKKVHQEIELHNLINENIDFASITIDKKKIKVLNTVSKQCKIIADRVQIDVVLRNLLNNALKFTPNEGGIVFNAIEKPDYWQISVKDTGVGIEPEILKLLFKKIDATVTRLGTNEEPGTGIGLLLSKEMVENHGGTIWVESVLNQGSTFYFTIAKLA